VLCDTMCSLNPGKLRLTLSVWFKLTEEGVLIPGCRFDRSIIQSKGRFSYEQAQKIIKAEISSQK
jgi:exoribonuclease R